VLGPDSSDVGPDGLPAQSAPLEEDTKVSANCCGGRGQGRTRGSPAVSCEVEPVSLICTLGLGRKGLPNESGGGGDAWAAA
jgi:hypothetical protein